MKQELSDEGLPGFTFYAGEVIEPVVHWVCNIDGRINGTRRLVGAIATKEKGIEAIKQGLIKEIKNQMEAK